MEVGIDVDKRIATYLHFAVRILLDGKLANHRQIVRSLILREVSRPTAKFDGQHLRNLELQEEVGKHIQVG